MNKKYCALLLLVLLSVSGQAQKHVEKQQLSKKERKYIPKDIGDCFAQMNKLWGDTLSNQVRNMSEKEFAGGHHFGLGMWMRNNWKLWAGSRLSNYFNEMGIYHPDDMSSIILHSYYRHTIGADIGLQKQVKFYQDYWMANALPDMKTYPPEAKDLLFDAAFDYDTRDSGQGVVHVGHSIKTGQVWIYDHYLGWLKVTNQQLHTLDSVDTREQRLKALYAGKQ